MVVFLVEMLFEWLKRENGMGLRRFLIEVEMG